MKTQFKHLFACVIILFPLPFILEASVKKDSVVVQYSDLSFSIEQEKENFIFDPMTTLIDLLYFTDNYNTSQQELENFKSELDRTIKTLQTETAKIKKRDKQIKLIYKTIHDRFLNKYETEANFHDLVSAGIYNCVTASALYAQILEIIGIPYNIKETPRHVYLIAFPEEEQIMIETTDPTVGYSFFNDEYKTLFVQNLRKSKIISEQEFESMNTNELFEKFYYASIDINLQELVSIHYSNNAIFYLEKQKIRPFQEQIKKAYFLYPCTRNSFLLFTASLLILEKVDYNEEEEINDLLFLCRFIDFGINYNDIVNEFIKITHEYLTNSNRQDEYDKIYHQLDSVAQDEAFKNELGFIYNYEKGRGFLLKGQYLKSYPFVKQAFGYKSGNSDAQLNLISNLSSLISVEKSSSGTLEEMDSLAMNFPVLLENNNFIQLHGVCQLKCIEEFFKEKQSEKGIETINAFELLTQSYPIVKFSDDFIGRAYSEAAVFYFKNGQNSKSRAYLNKGLELAPRSNELKSRFLMLN